MDNSRKRIMFFFTMIALWFANLAVFAHYCQSFGDAGMGAFITTALMGAGLGLILFAE